MKTIKKITRSLLMVAVIVTAICGISYLIVSNNFGLFMEDGVTYSIFEFMQITSKWKATNTYLLDCLSNGLLISLIITVIYLTLDFIDELKGVKAQ